MANPEQPTIAILASGSGTTAEYVVHATLSGVLQANVGLVITNNSDAGILQRIARLNKQYHLSIESLHISGATHPGGPAQPGEQTDQEAEAIADACREFSLVALLGYMKKVRGGLLDRPTVNTHPGLLPETAGYHGIHVQERTLELGLPHSGQTLHFVNGNYDQGDIIAEHTVPVMPFDTPQTLFDAVQVTEKAHLPVDLNWLVQQL